MRKHFEPYLTRQKTLRSIIEQFIRLCIVYVVLNILGCLWKLNYMFFCVFRIPNAMAFKQFDSTKRTQLLKTYKKMCISVSDFYLEIINNTLNTTACVKWPYISFTFLKHSLIIRNMNSEFLNQRASNPSTILHTWYHCHKPLNLKWILVFLLRRL